MIRLNRNRCQYCRFKKCLAVGMSRDCKYIFHLLLILGCLRVIENAVFRFQSEC